LRRQLNDATRKNQTGRAELYQNLIAEIEKTPQNP